MKIGQEDRCIFENINENRSAECRVMKIGFSYPAAYPILHRRSVLPRQGSDQPVADRNKSLGPFRLVQGGPDIGVGIFRQLL